LLPNRIGLVPPSHRQPIPLRSSAGTLPHALLLVAYIVPVVYLAEQLARPADYVIETMGAPDAVGGLAIAILVRASFFPSLPSH